MNNFFCQDYVSKLCPDKNKSIDDHQVRYRLNHLSVLHQWFELETKIDIDYTTFTRYIPSYIQKPSHEGWGTYHCVICLNPQMKFEKLKQLKQKYACVKTVVDSTPIDVSELVKDEDGFKQFKNKLLLLNNEKFNILFSEWRKEKKPNCAAPVSTKVTITLSIQDFRKKFITEIDVSLSRNLSLFKKIIVSILFTFCSRFLQII